MKNGNGNGLTDAELEKVSGGTGAEGRYDRVIEKIRKALGLIELYKTEPGADESTARTLIRKCEMMIADLSGGLRNDAELQLKSVLRTLECCRSESEKLQAAYEILSDSNLFETEK